MPDAAGRMDGGTVYGLSCVESQVLFLMQEAGWEPACCYAGSLVPFDRLYAYFVVQNRPYAYFDLAVKAQDWLKSIGALTISRLPLGGALEGLEGDGCCLLPLKTEAVRRLFGKTPWRPDHYLLARLQGGMVVLYDDAQPVPARLSREELPGQLAGDGLRVGLIRPPAAGEKAAFRAELTRQARQLQRQNRDGLPPATYMPADTSAALEPVRDMLGMMRLLSKRLVRLLETEGRPVQGLQRDIGEMDHMYARLQYALRRGRGAADLVSPALAQMYEHTRRLADACADGAASAGPAERPSLESVERKRRE